LIYCYKIPEVKQSHELKSYENMFNFLRTSFLIIRYVFLYVSGYLFKKYFTISYEAVNKTNKILLLRSFLKCGISKTENYLYTFYLNFRNDKHFDSYFNFGYYVSLLMSVICQIMMSNVDIFKFTEGKILMVDAYKEKMIFEKDSNHFLTISCFSFIYIFYFHSCQGIFLLLDQYLASLKNFSEIESIFYTNKVNPKSYPDYENFKIAVKNNINKNRLISNYGEFISILEMIMVLSYRAEI